MRRNGHLLGGLQLGLFYHTTPKCPLPFQECRHLLRRVADRLGPAGPEFVRYILASQHYDDIFMDLRHDHLLGANRYDQAEPGQ
jgi:hypothetical protein